MTVGTTNSEVMSIAANTLPQVSEYCILNMKEDNFLLLDVRWIYDFYFASNNLKDKDRIHDRIRQYFKLEDLIDLCVNQDSVDFIYDIVQPSVEDNTISQEAETGIYTMLEGIYIELQDKTAQAIDVGFPNKEFKTYNLVGFLGTTAIIALCDREPQKYPSFKDLYGNLRDKHWKDKSSDSAVLQAFIPFVSDDCQPVS